MMLTDGATGPPIPSRLTGCDRACSAAADPFACGKVTCAYRACAAVRWFETLCSATFADNVAQRVGGVAQWLAEFVA